jgi:hypothetical protein
VESAETLKGTWPASQRILLGTELNFIVATSFNSTLDLLLSEREQSYGVSPRLTISNGLPCPTGTIELDPVYCSCNDGALGSARGTGNVGCA